MVQTAEAKSERIVRVGPDRVKVTETEVVIEARHPMPDWEVQELRPVPIYVEDSKYLLVEKRRAEKPFAVKYLLRRWPEGQSTTTKLFHAYDVDAVRERESHQRGEHFDELVRAFLLILYPFLGLLWSGTQRRLRRFGFVPHLISGVSAFLVFCLAFGQGVFAVVMMNASMRSGKMMIGGLIRAMTPGDYLHLGQISIPVAALDVLLTIALLADVAIRYSNYLRDDQWAGGFLEWIVPRGMRRAQNDDEES